MNIYAADGRKLETQFLTPIVAVNVPIGGTITLPASYRRLSGTIYVGNIEYKYSWMRSVGEPHRIHNAEGFVSFCPQRWDNNWYFRFEPLFHYFRRDHLGSVREVWRAGYNKTIRDFDENWMPIWWTQWVWLYNTKNATDANGCSVGAKLWQK